MDCRAHDTMEFGKEIPDPPKSRVALPLSSDSEPHCLIDIVTDEGLECPVYLIRLTKVGSDPGEGQWICKFEGC